MRRTTACLVAILLVFPAAPAVGVGTAQEDTPGGGTAGPGANATVTQAEGGSGIEALPDDPDARAQHVMIVTAEGNEQLALTGIAIDYGDAGVDLGDVSAESISRMGIDQGGDFGGARTDVSVRDDVERVAVDGSTVNVTLGGNFPIGGSDEVVVVLDGVVNPPGGEYEVAFDVNPTAPGGRSAATLRVGTVTTTVRDTPTLGPTGTGGPGFGVAAGLGAVLALALALSARRLRE